VLSNGQVFFAANDGTHGQELWKTAGTVMVADINPGSAGSSPRYLTDYKGTLFFGATDSSSLNGLWTSDGTATGTVTPFPSPLAQGVLQTEEPAMRLAEAGIAGAGAPAAAIPLRP
jgi:ELWxxDGT repeat protein